MIFCKGWLLRKFKKLKLSLGLRHEKEFKKTFYFSKKFISLGDEKKTRVSRRRWWREISLAKDMKREKMGK
jgi:hypothetical protein